MTHTRVSPADPRRTDGTLDLVRGIAELILGPGMIFAMHVFELCLVDVCVDLGGRHVGMSEQLLDDSQIGSASEQVGREAVPQGMRRQAAFVFKVINELI